MQQRRSDYDVTNRVKTAAAATVAAAVRRIYLDLYRKADVATLGRAFVDFAALYAGEHPGYNPCDTGYHDTQHVLDVTLAMARLLTATSEGGGEPLDARLFCLGVILAAITAWRPPSRTSAMRARLARRATRNCAASRRRSSSPRSRSCS